MKQSALEATLSLHLRAESIPHRAEYRFDPKRRWRADFAIPGKKILIECEGGTWTNGRHNRGDGFEKDCEKYNAASEQGWTILRYTKQMIDSGKAIDQIKRMA